CGMAETSSTPAFLARDARRERTVSRRATGEERKAFASVHGNSFAPEPDVGELMPFGGWVQVPAISSATANSSGDGETSTRSGSFRGAHFSPTTSFTESE